MDDTLGLAAGGRLADQRDSGSTVFPTSFSPDGTRFLVYGDAASNDDDIGIVSLEAADDVSPLVQTTSSGGMRRCRPTGSG